MNEEKDVKLGKLSRKIVSRTDTISQVVAGCSHRAVSSELVGSMRNSVMRDYQGVASIKPLVLFLLLLSAGMFNPLTVTLAGAAGFATNFQGLNGWTTQP